MLSHRSCILFMWHWWNIFYLSYWYGFWDISVISLAYSTYYQSMNLQDNPDFSVIKKQDWGCNFKIWVCNRVMESASMFLQIFAYSSYTQANEFIVETTISIEYPSLECLKSTDDKTHLKSYPTESVLLYFMHESEPKLWSVRGAIIVLTSLQRFPIRSLGRNPTRIPRSGSIGSTSWMQFESDVIQVRSLENWVIEFRGFQIASLWDGIKIKFPCWLEGPRSSLQTVPLRALKVLLKKNPPLPVAGNESTSFMALKFKETVTKL